MGRVLREREFGEMVCGVSVYISSAYHSVCVHATQMHISYIFHLTGERKGPLDSLGNSGLM